MGNLKQRLIKAGRDYNYAEGVKVKATTAVYADQIVYVDGNEGPYLTVKTADADLVRAAGGRLLIAKHDIPASGYGVCLPWKLVTTVATNGHNIGDPIYLADTADSTPLATNLVRACPTGDAKAIVVGRITKAGTVADGAGILVNASAPEERVQGGQAYVAGATLLAGRPLEFCSWVMTAGSTTTAISFEYPIRLIKVEIYKTGTTAGNVDVYNGASGTTSMVTQFAQGTTAHSTVTGFALNTAAATLAAETVVRIVRSDGDASDRVGLTFIRA